jgi:hypothetical protein
MKQQPSGNSSPAHARPPQRVPAWPAHPRKNQGRWACTQGNSSSRHCEVQVAEKRCQPLPSPRAHGHGWHSLHPAGSGATCAAGRCNLQLPRLTCHRAPPGFVLGQVPHPGAQDDHRGRHQPARLLKWLSQPAGGSSRSTGARQQGWRQVSSWMRAQRMCRSHLQANGQGGGGLRQATQHLCRRPPEIPRPTGPRRCLLPTCLAQSPLAAPRLE